MSSNFTISHNLNIGINTVLHLVRGLASLKPYLYMRREEMTENAKHGQASTLQQASPCEQAREPERRHSWTCCSVLSNEFAIAFDTSSIFAEFWNSGMDG